MFAGGTEGRREDGWRRAPTKGLKCPQRRHSVQRPSSTVLSQMEKVSPGGEESGLDPWELGMEKRQVPQCPPPPLSLIHLESTQGMAHKHSRTESKLAPPVGQQVREKQGREHEDLGYGPTWDWSTQAWEKLHGKAASSGRHGAACRQAQTRLRWEQGCQQRGI